MNQSSLINDDLTEYDVFSILRPALLDVISQNNADSSLLKLNKGKKYSSVFYDSQMAFRIYSNPKFHRFEIPTDRIPSSSSKCELIVIRKDDFCTVHYDPLPPSILVCAELLCNALDSTIDSIPKEFDCCSRFYECSKQFRCINPNHSLATKCGYRKILKSGRSFRP